MIIVSIFYMRLNCPCAIRLMGTAFGAKIPVAGTAGAAVGDFPFSAAGRT